jgi:hypothetical protein
MKSWRPLVQAAWARRPVHDGRRVSGLVRTVLLDLRHLLNLSLSVVYSHWCAIRTTDPVSLGVRLVVVCGNRALH